MVADIHGVVHADRADLAAELRAEQLHEPVVAATATERRSALEAMSKSRITGPKIVR